MRDLLEVLFINKTAAAGVIAWVISQLIKFISTLIFQRKVDFTKLTGSGGMPSSHSALVAAASLRAGMEEGLESPVFGLALVVSLIVMYDAAGVRQAVGRQARILNKVVNEVYLGREIRPGTMKELLGHTPIEVFFGAILGIIVALLL